MKQFIKDLPIYLNGFTVGFLIFGREPLGAAEWVMFALAGITFAWYGKNQKEDGKGTADQV